jgi:prepilin-type N-terminal cleavage/methylation domain-containing protein
VKNHGPGSDESGYTLVELLVSLAMASILLTMTVVITSTFFNVEKVVKTSYGNLNQLLPIGTTFQQYIRSAVSPDPPRSTGRPVPPFGKYKATVTGDITPTFPITPTSLTFFTNIGTRATKRIAEVTVTTTPTPTTTGKYRFTVKTTLPKTPTQSTCPTKALTTPKLCKFTPSTSRTAFTVADVTSRTIFTYHYAGKPTPTRKTAGKLLSTTTFATCTATKCTAASIESVGVNLVVSSNTHVGHSADEETVTYQISSNSQAFNPAVG